VILKVIVVLAFFISFCSLTGIAIHRSRRHSHVVVHHSSSSSGGNTRGGHHNHIVTPTTTTHPSGSNENDVVTIAMIGNSMQYFNDFPRYLEMISRGKIQQNSCLHGGASISSLLLDGNAMFPQFGTEKSLIGYDEGSTTDSAKSKPIYDFGACTVPQLLLGFDERIHDPGYAISLDDMNNTNPCRNADATYLHYAISTFEHHSIHNRTNSDIELVSTETSYTPHYPSTWDYVFINDNTMNPARGPTREHAMATLERFYVPWLQQTRATPIFLWTHAYTPRTITNTLLSTPPAPPRDMTGLTDIGNFTSLTRVGYQAYIDLLELYLPAEQKPKLAPVGLAFLAVYDDNREIWNLLFHSDGIHASPSGTFLQGCIVYYTIFNTMPDYDFIIRHDMSSLWDNARMMQHYWEPPNPYPTVEHAKYLYRIAEKIMVEHYIPPSYIHYTNYEIAYTGNKTVDPNK
jgi:hypothetical protein